MAAGGGRTYDENNYYRVLENPVTGKFYFQYRAFIFFWKTYLGDYDSFQDAKAALDIYKDKVEINRTLFRRHIVHKI